MSSITVRCASGVVFMCSLLHCGCNARSVTRGRRIVPLMAKGGSSTAMASRNGAAHLKNGFSRSQK